MSQDLKALIVSAGFSKEQREVVELLLARLEQLERTYNWHDHRLDDHDALGHLITESPNQQVESK